MTTIIALILICGFVILWLFHHFRLEPFANIELYLLLAIYFIMLSVTAYVFSSNNLLIIHKSIGYHLVSFRSIALAVVIAVIIWIIDYSFQVKLLHINMHDEAMIWYSKQSNIIAVFFSSVIFAPIIEEMLFRGIFLQSLNRYLSKFWTAVLLSGLFALIHFSFVQAAPLYFASMIYFGLTYQSRSIVPAIMAHIINNGITFVYYSLLINAQS